MKVHLNDKKIFVDPRLLYDILQLEKIENSITVFTLTISFRSCEYKINLPTVFRSFTRGLSKSRWLLQLKL